MSSAALTPRVRVMLACERIRVREVADGVFDLKGVHYTLRAAQFQVEQAEDGREALAKAISIHPDIVVTETRLPGMDGFALCDLLHSPGESLSLRRGKGNGDRREA